MTIEQLKRLRKQIVLNSLYTRDYENNMNIEPKAVQDFFDGYSEYIEERVKEDYGESVVYEDRFVDLCDKYDNASTLEEWYLCFDEEPLRELPSFYDFKPTFEGSSFFGELYATLGGLPLSKITTVERELIEYGQFMSDWELYEFLKSEDKQVLFDYAKANNLI